MQASEIEVDGRKMRILHHSDMCAWRAKTLFTKEPITIEWLNKLGPKDLLFDVGANIGLYTIYASMIRLCPVVAFEPESQNYAALNANIFHNQPTPKVVAYCCAIEDIDAIRNRDGHLWPQALMLTDFSTGGSCHQQGDITDFSGTKVMRPVYRQGSLPMPLDIFCLSGGYPTAVKVDVDGHEPSVVESYPWHLDRPPRTWIIEVNWNREDHREMVDVLEGLGYTWDQAQADEAKRITGAFTNVGETVFTLEGTP